jgi:hypothetical protein
MFRRFFSTLMISTFFIASNGLAEIVEIDRMKQILPHITKSTLVVFDLDNTIMETPQTLGSDQWFGYMERSYEAQGIEKPQSTNQAIDIWMEVQHSSRMQPVEASTPALVQNLQRTAGIKLIALTARPFELRYRTRLQLRKLGISFETPESHNIAAKLPPELHFDRGILSIGPTQNKGEVLKSFIISNGEIFDRVLFVDDKAKHVHNVESALADLPVENINFRYGAADPKVKSFNAYIADRQLEIFQRTGRLINDQSAQSSARQKVAVD